MKYHNPSVRKDNYQQIVYNKYKDLYSMMQKYFWELRSTCETHCNYSNNVWPDLWLEIDNPLGRFLYHQPCQ